MLQCGVSSIPTEQGPLRSVKDELIGTPGAWRESVKEIPAPHALVYDCYYDSVARTIFGPLFPPT